MAKTVINVGAVIGLSSIINSAKSTVSSTKSSLNSTRGQIDSRILGRNNLGNRLSNVSSQLSAIEIRISNIRNMVENGANSYYRTDARVMNMKNALTGRIKGLGTIGLGAGILNGSDSSKQTSDKTKVVEKGKGDSTFKKILTDDCDLEGAVLSGKSTTDGTILGFKSSGSAEGDVIGGSIKTKTQANWTPKDGEAGVEKSIEAEGHLAQGKLKGNIGLLGGEIGGTVGSVEASGKVGATLFKDGKFSPTLDAKVKAEAAAAKGNAQIMFGTDEFNRHVEASGTALGAEAEAGASVGVIKTIDPITKKVVTEYGIKGKVGAEAYLAKGSISGGFTLFGIKIDASIEGKAGAVGVSAEGKATTGGVSGKIGGALGLGAGVEISIDWSDFSLW